MRVDLAHRHLHAGVIYGAMSVTTSLRTREIGVRLALGATAQLRAE